MEVFLNINIVGIIKKMIEGNDIFTRGIIDYRVQIVISAIKDSVKVVSKEGGNRGV